MQKVTPLRRFASPVCHVPGLRLFDPRTSMPPGDGTKRTPDR
jgi:hypothetical protein